MSAVVANGGSYTGRTAWARSIPTPLRAFLTTETGGATVLLAAALAALSWVNVHAASYEEICATRLALELGDFGVSLSLCDWVNHGLMTFFFFVIALETRAAVVGGGAVAGIGFTISLLIATLAFEGRDFTRRRSYCNDRRGGVFASWSLISSPARAQLARSTYASPFPAPPPGSSA